MQRMSTSLSPSNTSVCQRHPTVWSVLCGDAGSRDEVIVLPSGPTLTILTTCKRALATLATSRLDSASQVECSFIF